MVHTTEQRTELARVPLQFFYNRCKAEVDRRMHVSHLTWRVGRYVFEANLGPLVHGPHERKGDEKRSFDPEQLFRTVENTLVSEFKFGIGTAVCYVQALRDGDDIVIVPEPPRPARIDGQPVQQVRA